MTDSTVPYKSVQYALGLQLSGSCANTNHRPLPRRTWLQLARSRLLSRPSHTSRTASNTAESEGAASHPLHATLIPLPPQLRKKREEEKEATHLRPLPLVIQPAFALSPLVVLVVLPTSISLAGFQILRLRSSS
jgi:hypothetical protein